MDVQQLQQRRNVLFFRLVALRDERVRPALADLSERIAVVTEGRVH